MAIFFFLVGLEIKREILAGELSTAQKSMLPIAGALGGMVVPALIFTYFNIGAESIRGWGIPMATDIAFALGVLSLGRGVPVGLKVFLAALAIVDDLGAVLVIAVFYSGELAWYSLGAAALLVLLLFIGNRAGIRKPPFFLVLGVALWFAILKSGVHATIAGVLLALTIPPRAFTDLPGFLSRGRQILDQLEAEGAEHPYSEIRQSAFHELEKASESVKTPLLRFEHALLPWVNFTILPLFAMANAGVEVASDIGSSFASPVGLGIILGLFVGKPVGILLFSWLAVRSGVAALARGVDWTQMMAVGFLGGVGFTMSLFIAGLAFPGNPLLETSKIGILSASTVAGVTGLLLLRRANRRSS
jgi:NhaA family Na+:H+ antiporter